MKRLRATLESAHNGFHQRLHRQGVYHRHAPLHRHDAPQEHWNPVDADPGRPP
jgi:hypothetical protein